MKRTLKKAMSVFLAFAMAAGLCVTAFAADSTTSDVEYQVKYQQTIARESLQYVNEFRTSDTWYWNSDNTTKTEVSGLNALTYDYDLEPAAMQRAAEIAIYFSHTRPNDTTWSTVIKENGYTYVYAGENLAAGSSGYCGTAQKTITLLEEEDENYAGQGHRRNMLGPNYTNYAMGCVYVNSTYYWAMILASPKDSTNTSSPTSVNDTDTIATVNVSNSRIQIGSETFHDMALTIGESADLPDLKLYIKPSFVARTSAVMYCDISGTSGWTSSDSSVVSINGDKLTAVSAGTATITCSINGMTVSFKVVSEKEVVPVYVPEVPSTCETHGHSAYWYLEETGQYFADEAMTKEITLDDTILPVGTHTYTGPVTIEEPTCTEPGYQEYTCTGCGNTYDVVLPATGHEYTSYTIEPTCTENGAEVTECICGDDHFEQVILATGHDWSDWDVDEDEGIESRVCKVCGEEEVIAIPGVHEHKWGEPEFHWLDDSTLTDDDGMPVNCVAVYTCDTCKETYVDYCEYTLIVTDPTCTAHGFRHETAFSSWTGETYSTARDINFRPATGHSWDEGTVIEESTCYSNGIIEYKCMNSSGEAGRCTATERNELPETAHTWDYDNAVFDYAVDGEDVICVAKVPCAYCNAEDAFECDVEMDEVIGTRSCGEDEIIIWRGYFTIDGKEYESGVTFRQDFEPTGDHQGTVTFNWNDDYTECEAVYLCDICGYEEDSDCFVTIDNIPENCGVDGATIYTAVVEFLGETYTDIVSIPIPATGDHQYGAPQFKWAGDYSSCDAIFTCEVCGDSFTLPCDVTESETAPTHTETGTLTHVASVEFDGRIYTDTETETLPAEGHTIEVSFIWIDENGHVWGDEDSSDFTWNENVTCVAILSCVDGDYVYSEDCKVTCDINNGVGYFTAVAGEYSVTVGPFEVKELGSLKDAHEELIDELTAEVEAAENLKESNYTSESWNEFEEALEHAKEVLNDENATDVEIEEAIQELEGAMSGLQEKSSDTTAGTTTGTVNNGSSSGTSSASGNTNGGTTTGTDSGTTTTVNTVSGTNGTGGGTASGTSSSGTSSSGTESTEGGKTGDASVFAGFAVLAAAAGLAGTVVIGRKTKKGEGA